jgi:hypothetical protein
MDWNFSDILYIPQINNTSTDTQSAKLSGDKGQKQEHLMLCSFKEAFIKFEETDPDIAVSFSECFGLPEKPKCCFLFGAWYTHHKIYVQFIRT